MNRDEDLVDLVIFMNEKLIRHFIRLDKFRENLQNVLRFVTMSHEIIKRRAEEYIGVLILTPIMKREMGLVEIEVVRILDVLQVVLVDDFDGVEDVRVELVKNVEDGQSLAVLNLRLRVECCHYYHMCTVFDRSSFQLLLIKVLAFEVHQVLILLHQFTIINILICYVQDFLTHVIIIQTIILKAYQHFFQVNLRPYQYHMILYQVF